MGCAASTPSTSNTTNTPAPLSTENKMTITTPSEPIVMTTIEPPSNAIKETTAAEPLPDLQYSMHTSPPNSTGTGRKSEIDREELASSRRRGSIGTEPAVALPTAATMMPLALAPIESPVMRQPFHLPAQEPKIIALSQRNSNPPVNGPPNVAMYDPSMMMYGPPGTIPLAVLSGANSPTAPLSVATTTSLRDVPPALGRGNGGGRSGVAVAGRGGGMSGRGAGFLPAVGAPFPRGAPIPVGAVPGPGMMVAPGVLLAGPAMVGGRGAPMMGRGRGRPLQIIIPNGAPVPMTDGKKQEDHDDADDEVDDDDDDMEEGDEEVLEWDLGDEEATEDGRSPAKSAAMKPPPEPTKKKNKINMSKFQYAAVELDDFEVVNDEEDEDDDDDDDDFGGGNGDEIVDDWLDDNAEVDKVPTQSIKHEDKKDSLKTSARSVPSTPHPSPTRVKTPMPPSPNPNTPPQNPFGQPPRQPTAGNVSPNRGIPIIAMVTPTAQSPAGFHPPMLSPTKVGSTRTNLVMAPPSVAATGGLLPMVTSGLGPGPGSGLGFVDPNAAASSPTGTSIIRDTKVVKKKKAELPSQTNLPHPQPKFGDWLNSRTMINNYIILESLGAGSYAEVKLCKEKVSGKLFAMKFINREIMKHDKLGKQSKLDDIKREIAIMKKLNHPNVLRLYEVMDDPKINKLFLVLEYMKHGDLLSHQKKKYAAGSSSAGSTATTMGDRDLHCVLLQVLLGLAYLHEQKIVHGDIKPQNLLVGDKDVVKIADFGISQTLYGSKQKITDSAGTPAFMSPEMCSGEEYSGQLADIWAVGATIYMLKYGNPPFVAKSALQVFEKIQRDPLVFPVTAPPIDPSLEDLLRGMMTKDPRKRMTLLQVMTHPWVTKDEQAAHFSLRQPAPQITVSKDEVDHALDADKFKVIVDIRIQMMKRLHQAREEVVQRHQSKANEVAKQPSHCGILTKSNKIHVTTHDDTATGHDKMLSSEEIQYRAQLFSRKKPSAATTTSVAGMASTSTTVTTNHHDDESFSSDEDDGLAVSQSPQLLDELLLTTLSMPPLTKHAAIQEQLMDQDSSSDALTLHDSIVTTNGSVEHAYMRETASGYTGPEETYGSEWFYGENASLALQFAVASLEGRRNTQEDRWVVLPTLQDLIQSTSDSSSSIVSSSTGSQSAFVGLYDGHGGEECANILQDQLHSWLLRMPEEYLHHPEKLEKCFLELDSFVCDYLLHKEDLSGSTATCVLLRPNLDASSSPTKRKLQLLVAHVGDCRLVLCRRNGEMAEITTDHRLTLDEERHRILQLGGRVINNRVNGVMAITRAFGDLEFKGMVGRMKPGSFSASSTSSSSLFATATNAFQTNPFATAEEEKIPALLTALPDVRMLELDPTIDDFLILACDGLWDVMSSEEATAIVRDRLDFHKNLQLAAKELAQEAIRRYSNDNITVILIWLREAVH